MKGISCHRFIVGIQKIATTVDVFATYRLPVPEFIGGGRDNKKTLD